MGVDISQGVVDLFNKRTEHLNMQAVCVELKGEPGELGDEKFDVIVVRKKLFRETQFMHIRTYSVLLHTITSRLSVM